MIEVEVKKLYHIYRNERNKKEKLYQVQRNERSKKIKKGQLFVKKEVCVKDVAFNKKI